MTGALYGPIGLAIAGAAALEGMRRVIKDAAEEVRKFKDELDKITTDTWENQLQSLQKVRDAARETQDAIDEVHKAQAEREGKKDETDAAVLKEQNAGKVGALEADKRRALDKVEEDRRKEEELRRKEHVTAGEDEFVDRYAKRKRAVEEHYDSQIALEKAAGLVRHQELEPFTC